MASDKQVIANRENTKKSTGPRTNSGKTRTAKNALKHGLLAQDAVLPGEDPAEFDQHITSFEDTYLPRNRVEKEIVRQIADSSWRMQRLSRIETAVIAAGIDNTRRTSSLFNHDTGPMPEDRQERTHILGWTMLTRIKLLNSLARYDGHLGRRFFRGVELMIDIRREERQLREAREAREVQPGYDPDPPLIRYEPPPIPDSPNDPPLVNRTPNLQSRENNPTLKSALANDAVANDAVANRAAHVSKRYPMNLTTLENQANPTPSSNQPKSGPVTHISRKRKKSRPRRPAASLIKKHQTNPISKQVASKPTA